MPDPSTAAAHPATQRTRHLAAAALIAAFAAIGSYVAVPVGAVPVTLQTFAVFLATLVLPAGWAAASMAVYVALGVAGLPVFSAGQAGAGVLSGPTGGYLVGFVAGAGAGAAVRSLASRRVSAVAADIAGVVVTLILVYVLGVAWLATVTGMGPFAAIAAGALPFLPGDVVKAAAAVLVARALRRAGVR